MNSTKKYYPLYRFFESCPKGITFSLTFARIEETIRASLPKSAYTSRSWWGNSLGTQSEAWVTTGWLVDCVNFSTKEVVFRPKEITCRITPRRRRLGWTSMQVRALRKFVGWTQQDLANKMGMRGQQTISEWETGQNLPRFSTSKHLDLIAKEVGFLYQPRDTKLTEDK